MKLQQIGDGLEARVVEPAGQHAAVVFDGGAVDEVSLSAHAEDATAAHLGVIYASPRNAEEVLGSGAVVLAFTVGDHDAFRPTQHQRVTDFAGYTGAVRTALNASVPIVARERLGIKRIRMRFLR